MNERELLEYLATQDARIKQLYNELIQQLADIGMSIGDIPADQIFSFNNYPDSVKRVTEALEKYSNALVRDITTGISNAFVLSFAAQTAALGNKSAFTGIALDNLRNTARDSFLDYRLKPKRGLSLSQRVWNYTLQSKAEFEMAMSDIVTDGLRQGESAESLGRRVRGLLNNPDAMYRRYHLKKTMSDGTKKDVVEWRKRTVDADGKVHFTSTDIEHPGAGVYRSARQNALRLAATEVNMAYRNADWVRWQNEPFVIGIKIELSGNHTCKDSKGKPQPLYDICDMMVGNYPKSFKFTGWHPRCYDDKSEVLTDRGWLFFKDVQPTDKIFSLIPESKSVEWVGISKMMSWEHEGLMYHFHNRSLDCLVTPEHEMVHLSKDGTQRILRKDAKDYSKNNGGFYRSSKYDNEDVAEINLNGLTVPFDAFCEFMGYYLSDGSACRLSQISIAQQDCPTKPKIVMCIQNMGLMPHVTDSKVYVYNQQLCEYLKQFGHSVEKYVPKEIKNASKRQIKLFLDAFNACDGSIKKPHGFVGNRGGVCEGREVRVFFTSSKRMAADLGELLVKVGSRPSYRIDKKEGEEHTFRNGTYKLNADAIRVTECYSESCTVFSKDEVQYKGMVYDLELERNHIMYIRRNGKCFWGSNCRCTVTSILVSDEEFEEIRKLPAEERANYVSPNMITDMPEGYDKYVSENLDRINQSIERGKEPYWVRDNYDGKIGRQRIVRDVVKVEPTGMLEPKASSPTAPIKAAQTTRKDGRVLSSEQLAEVMAKDREAYEAYLLANMDELEKLFGVPRGTSMSWELANKGSENPRHWRFNCQTCTVTHELRRRGFNVTAMSKADGFNKLTHKGKEFSWQYRFLNPDGSKIEVELTREWAKRKKYGNMTRKRMDEYFAEKMTEDGRYEIYCEWDSAKGAKSGAHVFLAEKKDGVIKFFDPQTGEAAEDIEYYFTMMQNKQVYAMRIDDKIINPEMVKAFVADAGIIDTTGYVFAQPKSAIDLATEARHAKRDVAAIRKAVEIRLAMSKEDMEIYHMLNDVARLEGKEKLGVADLFRVADRDDNGFVSAVKVRRSGIDQYLIDAIEKYDKTMQSLSKIDVASLGKKRSEILRDYIAQQRLKAISSIARGKTTWVDAPYNARKKFKELQAQRAAIMQARREELAAMNGGKTMSLADAKSLEDVRAIFGADMPKTLEELDDAIRLYKNVDKRLVLHRDKIEKWMRELFEDSDYGMQVDSSILESIADKGFLNTFQVGRSGGYSGSSKTTGKIEKKHGRLVASHQMFMPSTHKDIVSYEYIGAQLEREEYEKYGHLLMRDKVRAVKEQRSAFQYGNVQVRFRKDKVVCTWTYDDSLGKRYQPTLCCDPKVESFDKAFTSLSKSECKDVVSLVDAGCSRYIELQYHGKVTIDAVESLTFESHPIRDGLCSEETLRRYAAKGAKIYYIEKGVAKEFVIMTEVEAKKNAQMLLDVADAIENADISLSEVRKAVSSGKYFDAYSEAEKVRAKVKELKDRADLLRAEIPSIDDFHKEFTMDQIEEAYKYAKKSINKYIADSGGDLEYQLKKLSFQRDYVERPQDFIEGRVRHSTWRITQQMYDEKIKEVKIVIKRTEVTKALDDIKAYNTRSSVIKGHIKDAEELLAKGDFDGASEAIAKANKVKADYEYQKAYEARKKAEKMKGIETMLKEGESHGIVFDEELFTQAQKDQAKWFRGASKNPTSAEIRKAFKEADDYMSHYAEEMWSKLSKEEKEILWLYTDGSKYINEEMLGVYRFKLESIVSNTIRNGLKDANVITTIIDKAPALQEGMWMQSGMPSDAIWKIFGARLSGDDMSHIVGKEGASELFLSCHSARNGLFTMETGIGSKNDVVLSIYMPKGTKGVYMEPFASYGDEKNPYKRGVASLEWDGTKRNETPSNQVEFLLQRGTKFRITKVVKGDNGKWYIDVDIIEQPAQKALSTSIPGLKNRTLRTYRPYES